VGEKVRRASNVTLAPPSSRQACLTDCVEILNQILQAIDVFSRQSLRDFGVTGPQLWALRTIGAADVASMSDLAQHLHLHMSTVTGIIDRLEAARLVTRDRSEEDARVMEIRLTSKGRGILSRAPEPPRSKAARGLQKLPLRRLRQVRTSLMLIARAMDLDILPPE
jgi:MarR family transcriptional regulator, organic hydroperoxide resistance regulator